MNDYLPSRLQGTQPGRGLYLPCDRCGEVRLIIATATGLLCGRCSSTARPSRAPRPTPVPRPTRVTRRPRISRPSAPAA